MAQKQNGMDLNLQRHWSKKKDVMPFENDLIAIVQNTRFRKTKNCFQKKLQKDIQLTESSDKMVTFADKTTKL